MIVASNSAEGTSSPTSRVVVIGFDAADVDLMLAWAKEGVLPAFRSLLDRAAWGRVKNDTGNVAGTAWQNFHTGVWPGKHGHYEGVKHFDPASYEDGVYFTKRSQLPVETIWESVSTEGKRVAILDAPYVFMSEHLNGVQLNGWGTHERGPLDIGRFDFVTEPPSLRDEVLRTYGNDPMGISESPCDSIKPRNAKEVTDLRDPLIRQVEIKAQMAVDFLKREPWSYFEADFFSAHCIGHQCWHLHDPSHPRYDADIVDAVGDPIKDVYVALDAALSKVLDAAGKDATVIVYLSHGMGPNYTATGGTLDRILRRLDHVESPVRAERLLRFARNVWRSAPGPVRKLLIPLQARRFEATVQRRIQPARATRKFFEMHLNGATGGVRINLKGREANGIVEPGAEYEDVCAQLTRDLMEVMNPDTGKPLVAVVRRASDLYEGPYFDRMPDLLVEWNRHGPISRATSPKIGLVEDPVPNLRTGDHRPDGWFAALAPGIEPGEVARTVTVVDFAPTIAALLQVKGIAYDGKPIEELMPRVPIPVTS
jgi:predicted AlkP superfamily phosphohydrolase/phosphomutase